MAESDTWEGIENLENAKELVEEFKREYRREKTEIRKQKSYKERNEYWRGMFPGRFTARKLYGWDNKKYDREYWNRMERNWRKWKGMKPWKQRKMKMIEEEEKEEKEEEYQGGKIEE